ncbi:PucR family transcriptional regulator [Brevibacillus fluminis]|uniref:PucR family transcriptional regulator n=1 Tax=Brevibacillus fluminis TaxID=511487 RepID=A0A3M8D0X3_9BACL|nr:PucR family transcriptional regulator [Brevibacillus fluminis]RNB81211.1 PucR family transcriptional regulator [Brevibacillus fluminis]
MSVTVKDILALSPFHKAQIIAGANGMDNVIKRVSFSDSPYYESDDFILKDGIFCISSFYFAKQSVADMYEFIKRELKSNASGLCLTNEHISVLPDEIRNYCDQNQFPVIMVDNYVPYADIISGIMELIIIDQQNTLIENKIDALVRGQLDNTQTAKILSELNPHFQSQLTVIYCTPSIKSIKSSSAILSILKRNMFISAFEYKSGLLILVSYKESTIQSIQEKIDYVIETIINYYEESVIGISSNNNILECGQAVNQALTAVNVRDSKNSNIIYYDKLGLVRLLTLFSGHKELEKFHNDILGPIFEYDKKTNQSNLFETIMSYIENGRDYKKTASALFLHENTIRYRVGKVQELLESISTNVDILEDISIAIKIYKLRKAERTD